MEHRKQDFLVNFIKSVVSMVATMRMSQSCSDSLYIQLALSVCILGLCSGRHLRYLRSLPALAIKLIHHLLKSRQYT